MQGFKLMGSKRWGFDFIPGKLKNFGTKPLNYLGWGPERTMPDFANKSFSQQYRNKKQNKITSS